MTSDRNPDLDLPGNPMLLPWKLEPCDNPADRSRTVDCEGHFIFGDNCGPTVREAKFILDCVNKVESVYKLLRKPGCWYAEKKMLEKMVERLSDCLESVTFRYIGAWLVEFSENKELVAEARKLLEDYANDAP